MTSHLLRLWVIGSYEMPRCDWLQHCNFLARIEILPFALQTACKPCGFAAGRPAIVAGPVLRVAIGESCSVCRALYLHGKNPRNRKNPPQRRIKPTTLHRSGQQAQDTPDWAIPAPAGKLSGQQTAVPSDHSRGHPVQAGGTAGEGSCRDGAV